MDKLVSDDEICFKIMCNGNWSSWLRSRGCGVLDWLCGVESVFFLIFVWQWEGLRPNLNLGIALLIKVVLDFLCGRSKCFWLVGVWLISWFLDIFPLISCPCIRLQMAFCLNRSPWRIIVCRGWHRRKKDYMGKLGENDVSKED